MTVSDIPKVIQAKSIKTRLQLVCLATTQEREGQHCLAQSIASRGRKAVAEVLALAKEFSSAESQLEHSKKMGIQLLGEAKESECVAGCAGKWYEAALQVLTNQGIMPLVFCGAVHVALSKGRGKFLQ